MGKHLKLGFCAHRNQRPLFPLGIALSGGLLAFSYFTGACFITRQARQIKDQNPTSFYGPLCVDVFNCEKILVPESVLRIRLTRSSDEFSIISIDGKPYHAVIEQACLFVRKICLSDQVKVALNNNINRSPLR